MDYTQIIKCLSLYIPKLRLEHIPLYLKHQQPSQVLAQQDLQDHQYTLRNDFFMKLGLFFIMIWSQNLKNEKEIKSQTFKLL